MTDVLINMRKKLDVFSCLLNEMENAEAEIGNTYDQRIKSDIDDFYSSFFELCRTEKYKMKIDFLHKKIMDELSVRCKHQFVEDDIECNMEDMHISYCIICELKK